MNKQTCRICEKEKPLDDFYFDKARGKHRTDCKSCNGELRREREYLRLYGITTQQFREMREAQGHRCLICGKSEADERRRLNVDHCHETGKVRGLLCDWCNRGIGFFKDDPELMKKAIDYLHDHEEMDILSSSD